MKQTYILAHDIARQRAIDAIRTAQAGFVVTLAEPTRTSAENALATLEAAINVHQTELDSIPAE